MIRLSATKIIMVSIKEKKIRILNHNLKRYDLLDLLVLCKDINIFIHNL